jgi:hypothetical protein
MNKATLVNRLLLSLLFMVTFMATLYLLINSPA